MKVLSQIPKDQPTPKETNSVGLTESQKHRAIIEAHEGHFCAQKTLENLRWKRLKWEGVDRQVKEYCRRCIPCQKFKKRQRYDDLGSMLVEKPNQLTCMDVTRNVKRGKHRHRCVFTCTDSLIRHCLARSFKLATAENSMKTLQDWIHWCGKPESLLTDNGCHFIGSRFREFCQELDIQTIRTPTYSHECAGITERLNGTLIGRIGRLKAESGKRWTQLIQVGVKIINRKVNTTTKMTPEYVVWGILHNGVKTSSNKLTYIWRLAKERFIERQEAINKKYIEKLQIRSFDIGSKVWMYDNKIGDILDTKFDSKWIGPCTVVGRHSDRMWHIRLPDARRRFRIHSDFLRHFTESGASTGKRVSAKWLYDITNKRVDTKALKDDWLNSCLTLCKNTRLSDLHRSRNLNVHFGGGPGVVQKCSTMVSVGQTVLKHDG